MPRNRRPGAALLAPLVLLAPGAAAHAVAGSAAKAPPRCSSGALSASVSMAGVGLGNVNAHVYLRNRSAQGCTLRGYARIGLEDARARPQRSLLVRGNTYFATDPGARTLVLAPGARAVMDLAWTDMPTAGESQTGPCEPVSAWLELTPPGDAGLLRARFGATVCDHGRMRGTAFSLAHG